MAILWSAKRIWQSSVSVARSRGGRRCTIAAPRWVLSREPTTAFDTWDLDAPPLVRLEHDAPAAWSRGLRARGFEAIGSPPGDQSFGHAQLIRVTRDDMLAGAADPRSGDGAFAGW
jgi:gamma-glutamyltranspeptidase